MRALWRIQLSKSADKSCSVTAIQIKAVEQYFAVGRAVCMWYKVVLAFESVDEIL